MIALAILEARLGLYHLLSALYRYPLKRDALEALAGLEISGDTPVTQSLRELQLTLEGIDAGVEERLNIEMTRLVEGPGLTPAPPYASYYLNDGQLMGAPAQTARRTYLEWQALPEAEGIPPDHVALELGFLAFLAEKALVRDGEGRLAALHASQAFLRQQVLPWLPQFCTNIGNNAHEAFFAKLARLTLLVIQADSEWLEEVLSELNPTEITKIMPN